MVRVRVIREGKPKDAHLRALQSDYATRIGHFVQLRVEESGALQSTAIFRPSRSAAHATNHALRRLIEGLETSYVVLLDPAGRELTSEKFSEWLGGRALAGTRELAFLVGGDRGLPEAVRGRGDLLLSLSRMTLTHDWACTLLFEQIYRGFTILRGYPYAR